MVKVSTAAWIYTEWVTYGETECIHTNTRPLIGDTSAAWMTIVKGPVSLRSAASQLRYSDNNNTEITLLLS